MPEGGCLNETDAVLQERELEILRQKLSQCHLFILPYKFYMQGAVGQPQDEA